MNRNGSLKWLWASLMIIGLIIVCPVILFFVSFWGYSGRYSIGDSLILLIPLVIAGLLVWGLISLFSKKSDEGNKKVYKSGEIKESMRVQYLFYIVGIIFVFIAVGYFVREYIAQFPKIIKLVLLLVSVVVSYIVAEFMRESDI